jgi:ATP-binding cassette subfamily F protein 3
MLIKLDQVHKSYGSHQVLSGVSFQVNPGEHVGLVGRNGAGKTTIFRIVSRIEEPDAGQLSLARSLKVEMLAQQPQFDDQRSLRQEALSVFERLRAMESEMSRLEHLISDAAAHPHAPATSPELDAAMHQYSDLTHQYEMSGGFSYPARAEAVLFGLGFTAPDLDQPAAQLSGGQKGRLALAKLLLAEPDLLLLDEPTNHLDVNAVEWLEDFLSAYKRAFIIISHDRFLLDKIASKIIEVDRGTTTSYPGNYTAYTRQRDERRLSMARQYEQQQDMIARTEEFIRRNIAGQKTKQAKSRRNMLERLDRIDAIQDAATTDFKVAPAPRAQAARGGRSILTAAHLSVGYPSKPLVTNMSLILQHGERLAVVGPNGSGKTTLLKTLAGKVPPLAGEFHWAANLKIAFYDQELTGLDPDSTVLGQLQQVAPRLPGGTPDGALRSFLAKFLFTDEAVFKPVSVLSGGELSRLALARLIYPGADVLVLDEPTNHLDIPLDEPTNHLDIPSREALEAALAEFTGTIIVVSHDRYFLSKLASQVLELDQGIPTHRYGRYLEFYEATRQHPTNRDQKQSGPAQIASRSNKSAPRPKQTSKKGRSQTEIEAEISLLEAELAELSEKLAQPTASVDFQELGEMGSRHNSLAAKLEALYQEWEAAASAADE